MRGKVISRSLRITCMHTVKTHSLTVEVGKIYKRATEKALGDAPFLATSMLLISASAARWG